jgi:hypothetical protein
VSARVIAPCGRCAHARDLHAHLRPGDDCSCGCPGWRRPARRPGARVIARVVLVIGAAITLGMLVLTSDRPAPVPLPTDTTPITRVTPTMPAPTHATGLTWAAYRPGAAP